MRSFVSIGVAIGSICLAAILLVSPGGELAGQTTVRRYCVRGAKPTPEIVEGSERQRTLLVDGWKVTPAEAAQFEEELAKDSENLPLRLRLMSYYMQQVMNEKYVRHISWLTENHPDSDVFQDSEMVTRMPFTGLGGPGSVERTRYVALWKEQANRFPRNPKVLRNAAKAVVSSEPALTVQFVKAARQAEPGNPEWTTWLAKIYAVGIRWTYWDQKSMMTFTGEAADYRHPPFWLLPLPMCEELKREVETSTDAALVAAVGDMLIREARLIEPDSVTPDVEKTAHFGEVLAGRARMLKAVAVAGR